MRSAHKSLPELKQQRRALETERNRVVIEFLLTDVAASLTFAEEAVKGSNSAEKRKRNRMSARKGYEAVVHFSKRVEIPSDIQSELNRKLRELKSTLTEAGEQF